MIFLNSYVFYIIIDFLISLQLTKKGLDDDHYFNKI
jgi:hypothetical protein